MEEARRVIDRLERIEKLRGGGASRALLLAEVRGLLEDGEAWLAVETGETARAQGALDECRRRMELGKEVAPAVA